jgi:hypothetical protein
LTYRPQISSDALFAYREAVEYGFGANADYGQIVKTYTVVNLNKDTASRYSPAEVVKTEKTIVQGAPNVNLISTSHVEKQNHTLRMHCSMLRYILLFYQDAALFNRPLRGIAAMLSCRRENDHFTSMAHANEQG